MLREILLKSIFVVFLISSSACNNKQTENKQNNTTTNTVKTEQIQTSQTFTGEISIDKLPKIAVDFIKQNYADYTIVNASYDPLCSGENAIDVSISKNGKNNLSLIFLVDGSYVQKEEDLDIKQAPTKVLQAIKEKFPGYKPDKSIEKLTLANNTIQYSFDLLKGDVSKEVIFNEDGTVACE